MTELIVAGRGQAHDARREHFNAAAGPAVGPRATAQAALAAIRYADPASWTTATAVAQAVAAQREAVLGAHDRVAVVVTSADGPVEAMAAMREATLGGSSSPIRFPASNAGSLAGLAGIGFGFRGPTMMLTLPPARGVPVGLLLADAWLGRGVTAYVVLASCRWAAGARPSARCLLLASAGPGEVLERARDAAWLSEAP